MVFPLRPTKQLNLVELLTLMQSEAHIPIADSELSLRVVRVKSQTVPSGFNVTNTVYTVLNGRPKGTLSVLLGPLDGEQRLIRAVYEGETALGYRMIIRELNMVHHSNGPQYITHAPDENEVAKPSDSARAHVA